MGSGWSIIAKNTWDRTWTVCDYNLTFLGFVIKGIYCLIKYDVVELGKHG